MRKKKEKRSFRHSKKAMVKCKNEGKQHDFLKIEKENERRAVSTP